MPICGLGFGRPHREFKLSVRRANHGFKIWEKILTMTTGATGTVNLTLD